MKVPACRIFYVGYKISLKYPPPSVESDKKSRKCASPSFRAVGVPLRDVLYKSIGSQEKIRTFILVGISLSHEIDKIDVNRKRVTASWTIFRWGNQ